jgi:hypothetical protein
MDKLCAVNEAFDTKVYTNNRNMKCVNQCKQGKAMNTTQLCIPIDGVNIGLDQHLITAFVAGEPVSTIPDFVSKVPVSMSVSPRSPTGKVIELEPVSKVDGYLDILSLPTRDYAQINGLLLELDLSVTNLELVADVLPLLPMSQAFPHSYTHMVARFCFHNRLEFEVFHNWYTRKSESIENERKWRDHWASLDKFPTVSLKSVLFVLQRYYPNIMVKQEFQAFDVQCDTSKEDFVEVETLAQEHFELSTKAIVFHIGMGGGKTTQTLDYLYQKCSNFRLIEEREKDNLHKQRDPSDKPQNFVWITPNVALAQNTFGRLELDKIKHFVDEQGHECWYEEKYHDTGIYNRHRQKEHKKAYIKSIEHCRNLFICMHSFRYAKGREFDIVVIDEIETFLKLWCYNDILKGDVQYECYTSFKEILLKAKKIILLDAFVTNITLQFFRDLGIDFTIVRRKDELSFNKRSAVKYHHHKHLTVDIVKALKAGKKCIVFYPHCRGSKKIQGMGDFRETILKATEVVGSDGKVVRKKSIVYHSDVADEVRKTLSNVNEHWEKLDLVISNNVITVGVNFDSNHFDQCFMYVAKFNQVRDVVQFSYRSRSLRDNRINFCFLSGAFTQDDSLLDKQTQLMQLEEFTNLREHVLIERSSPLQQTFQKFLLLAGYSIEPDEKELSKREMDEFKLLISNNSYYNYENISRITLDFDFDADERYQEILQTQKEELVKIEEDELLAQKAKELSLAAVRTKHFSELKRYRREILQSLVVSKEQEFYSGMCSLEVKLELRRYHFDNLFRMCRVRKMSLEKVKRITKF